MGKWAASLAKPRYFDDGLWGPETWPLLSACYTGDLETVVRMLDEDPARIQAQFAYYEPLHYAVRGGHAAVVKLLLDRGAHPKAAGWGGRLGDDTPITKALDREREDLAALLRHAAEALPAYLEPQEKPRSPEQELQFELAIACGNDDRARVEQILAQRPDLATAYGLYEAVHHGQTALARFLIGAGADVNGHMPWACWFTPLMHSLRYREPRWELAEMLIEHGVPVDSTNGLGMTALHIVVLEGGVEAAGWLLDRGADINRVEPEFCSTPLGWAARWGRIDMAKLLLERDADRTLPLEYEWALPRRWALKKVQRDISALLG
jgi:uncharacterized protein